MTTAPLLRVWPPLPLNVYVRRPAPRLPYPLGRSDCTVFARARHALWQGVQAIGLRPGDVVLAPAYHHGAEIEALLDAGIGVRFYGATATLEPDRDELEQLLAAGVRALYLTHYLGFPQDAAAWRAWCDEHSLLLIEDAAQAWLATSDGEPVGAVGDVAIYCLYKTFGVPDGAALRVGAPAPGPETLRRLQLRALAERHAAWLVGRSRLLARAAPNGAAPCDLAVEFALGDPGSPPSGAATALLPRLVDTSAAARRRANYGVLLSELRGRVEPPFDHLPPGASPFAFPLSVLDKPRVLAQMRRAGIEPLDLWPQPHPRLEPTRFPGAAARRARLLALPVHQELRPEDLERIVAACGAPVHPRREIQIEFADSFEDVRDTWSRLGPGASGVFGTWEWNETWWRHFGSPDPPVLAVCRGSGGRVLGILPLYRFALGPISILRFIGHGPSDHLGPVCHPADRFDVARALRRVLAELDADLLMGEHLPRNDAWSGLLGAHVLRTDGSPILRFEGTWEDYIATRSSNVRQQVRRFERKLLERGLRYRSAGTLDGLERDLEILFALHRARWRSSQFAGRHAAFHRDFARVAAELGWLRLWFLEGDDGAVAAWHGFRVANVESFYQSGRDPAWDGPPVGLVLLAHSIRAALDDGIHEYRFLRGAESYKYRFATDDPGVETVALARGALAATALAATRALPEPIAHPLRKRLVA